MSGQTEHVCPRREENPVCLMKRPDTWREGGSCSYCGSLNPETFMARLEAGDVEVGPTDKNYKVYVRNDGGEGFAQTYRDCPREERTCTGPDDCTHWVTREVQEKKFYFQHLSPEQKLRFIDLLFEGRIKLGYPGRFYVRPFFFAPRASS